MDFSLLLIVWYGMLHAFGPDHLTAIADFSIGKNRSKTLLVTVLFALGHGLSLFLFAKVLQVSPLSHSLLAWGDVISATVIFGMGLYLLYMVATDRIHLDKHRHEGKEHIHIWFGKSHTHREGVAQSSSFTMGLLMGAGGVRGMLVTLGAVGSNHVDMTLIAAFTAGVMVIFVAFGFVILYINEHFLGSLQNVRRIFAAAGVASLAVGAHILVN